MCRHCRNLMFICISIVAAAVGKKVATKLPLPTCPPFDPATIVWQQVNRAPWPLMNLQWFACLALAERVVGQDKLPQPRAPALPALLLLSLVPPTHTG